MHMVSLSVAYIPSDRGNPSEQRLHYTALIIANSSLVANTQTHSHIDIYSLVCVAIKLAAAYR